MTEKKQVYIDSNTYLDFFGLSKKDTKELEKLVSYIGNKFELLLPTQTILEVRRNRDKRLRQAMQPIKNFKANIQLPPVDSDTEEADEVKKHLKNLASAMGALLNKANELENKREFKADKLMNRILKKAKRIESGKVHGKARKRWERGDPPGKSNKSFGDEIIWETLLKYGKSKDLYLVSGDGDFTSSYDSSVVNPVLAKEWSAHKEGELILHRSLSSFFKDLDLEIKLEREERRANLVDQLRGSGTFARTHLLISKLEEFPTFTDAELGELVGAVEHNSQVGWILSDTDVLSFYDSLRTTIAKSKGLTNEEKEQFAKALKDAKDYRAELDSSV